MKKLIALILVSLLSMSTNIFASVDGKGSEVVENQRFKAGTTSSTMDGGYWTRGQSGSKVFSQYKHYTKLGRASTTNGEGQYHDGGWKEVNINSTSNLLTWTSKGINYANYDNKDAPPEKG